MQKKNLKLDKLHAGHGRIRSRYALITDEGSGTLALCVGFDGDYPSGARTRPDTCAAARAPRSTAGSAAACCWTSRACATNEVMTWTAC